MLRAATQRSVADASTDVYACMQSDRQINVTVRTGAGEDAQVEQAPGQAVHHEEDVVRFEVAVHLAPIMQRAHKRA